MEVEALSAAAAAEALRAQIEDRENHAAIDVNQAKERAVELEKRLDAELQKRQQLQQASAVKIQQLTAELDACTARCIAAEKSASSVSSSAAEAARDNDKKLADLQLRLDSAMASADKASVAAAESEQREACLSEEISTLKQQQQQREEYHVNQLSSLKLQLSDSSMQLASSSDALASAVADADTLKIAVEDLRQQLSAAVAASNHQRAENAKLEAQLVEAAAQLDIAVKHSAATEMKMAEMQSHFDAQRQAADASSSGKIAQLQKDLESANNNVAALTKEVVFRLA
jgi:chromosome segregation ATPase